MGFVSCPKSKQEYFDIIFDKEYDNILDSEQMLNAKKTLYLLDHVQVEKIKRGNIIPEKKAVDYKMPTEIYFKKINEKLELTDFKSDEYYLDLKKSLLKLGPKYKVMKKINLLDCTLRDGGYYNNWDFSKDLIQDYILSLNETGVEYIELGFRSLSIKNYMGPCAYTKDTFINSLKIPRGIKIGVMINASELISSKQPKRKLVQKLIDNKKSKISFVRFACHFKEINETLNLIKLIKNNKIKIILNIMQITERTPDEIQEVSKKISKSRVNVLYFADSMGGLSPDGIKKIIYQLKNIGKKDIGFHAHDNMGKALINAEQSVNFGVNWIDSTVSGMGRGPGNLKTEFALIQFKENLNRKVKLAPLLNLIDNRFKDLLTKYNWGSNPYYFLSGLYGIHPSFIQTMLNDLNLKPEEMLSIIENLNKNKATKFNKNLIEVGNQIYKGKTSGNWSPISIIKKKGSFNFRIRSRFH